MSDGGEAAVKGFWQLKRTKNKCRKMVLKCLNVLPRIATFCLLTDGIDQCLHTLLGGGVIRGMLPSFLCMASSEGGMG